MSKRKGTLDSESTAGCSKRTRKTVNKMFANDGSSTSPAQEVSHTLTDCLESAGQELHFSRICARSSDASLSRRLRGAGPCFLIAFCNSIVASNVSSSEELASAIGGGRAALPGEAVQEDRGQGRVDAIYVLTTWQKC